MKSEVPAVGLYGITKRFGEVTAVDDADLEITDGEFFALLGPSGCGKTTTLRLIAGLEFPTQGAATPGRVRPPWRSSPSWDLRVGYIDSMTWRNGLRKC